MPKFVIKKMSEKEAWKTTYAGHDIMVVNGLKARLYIDGREVEGETGFPIRTSCFFETEIGKHETLFVFVTSDAAGALTGTMLIGKKLKVEHGLLNKDNEFRSLVPFNGSADVVSAES